MSIVFIFLYFLVRMNFGVKSLAVLTIIFFVFSQTIGSLGNAILSQMTYYSAYLDSAYVDRGQMYLAGVSVRRVEDITETLWARRSLRAPSATSTRRRTTVTPKTKMKQVTLMLKAIHAQESKEAAQEKAASIAAKLREIKLLSVVKQEG